MPCKRADERSNGGSVGRERCLQFSGRLAQFITWKIYANKGVKYRPPLLFRFFPPRRLRASTEPGRAAPRCAAPRRAGPDQVNEPGVAKALRGRNARWIRERWRVPRRAASGTGAQPAPSVQFSSCWRAKKSRSFGVPRVFLCCRTGRSFPTPDSLLAVRPFQDPVISEALFLQKERHKSLVHYSLFSFRLPAYLPA